MAELVGDDEPDLVARVAVQQSVEQDDALGRAQAADICVGGGRPAARVDRVDRADAHPRRAGELEHI